MENGEVSSGVLARVWYAMGDVSAPRDLAHWAAGTTQLPLLEFPTPGPETPLNSRIEVGGPAYSS
jgi:hypothetical protein